jgi:hypothetical protein
VVSKFSAELYGFVEFDMIRDSTQSYPEIAGNTPIIHTPAAAGAMTPYGANHSRLTFSPRNSRFGVKLKGPDSPNLKTSAVMEMDFLGNQPSPISDSALLTNPTFRIRHMYLKLETPIVNVLAGQTWNLFGWGAYFFPNSVQIMGLPGQIFNRTPQLRLSHAFKTDDITFELAVAASRPAQRDGGVGHLPAPGRQRVPGLGRHVEEEERGRHVRRRADSDHPGHGHRQGQRPHADRVVRVRHGHR